MPAGDDVGLGEQHPGRYVLEVAPLTGGVDDVHDERGAHARDDVLALRVGQEVAARLRGARDLVARERDAGSRRVALVAEHHLLDVDRRAPVVGDLVEAPVGDRAVAHPRVEHGADRLAQLLVRVLREVLARVLLVDRLEGRGQLLQRLHVELGVELDAACRLGGLDRVLVERRRRSRARRCRTSARSGGRSPTRIARCSSSARARSPTRRSARGSGPCPSSPASSHARPSARRRAADPR